MEVLVFDGDGNRIPGVAPKGGRKIVTGFGAAGAPVLVIGSGVVPAPLDDEEFRRWRHQADGAAQTAALAATGGRHDWACFLCEQAARLG